MKGLFSLSILMTEKIDTNVKMSYQELRGSLYEETGIIQQENRQYY